MMFFFKEHSGRLFVTYMQEIYRFATDRDNFGCMLLISDNPTDLKVNAVLKQTADDEALKVVEIH